VLGELLQRDFKVRLLVHRTPPEAHGARIDIIHGDVHAPAVIDALLRGADCVVATLSSAQAAIPDVSSTAIGHLVPTMRALGIERIVSTTGSAARQDQEVGSEHPWLTARRTMLMRHMPDLILDGLASSGCARVRRQTHRSRHRSSSSWRADAPRTVKATC
jgi:hypothetical protein